MRSNFARSSRPGAGDDAAVGTSRLVAALICSLALVPLAYAAAPHPSLIDPLTTKCTTCHEVLLGESVHAAAIDQGCTNCHQFAKSDQQTTVAMAGEGPEVCLPCHNDMTGVAHGEVATPHAPVTADCTACHNPHSASHPRLLSAPVAEVCIGCHDAGDLRTTHGRTMTEARCLACHAPHGSGNPAMLASANQHAPFAERSCTACHRRGTIVRATPKEDVCFACHDESTFDARSVHSAVRQGKCAGCHDPHLGDDPAFVRTRGVELCTGCHRDIEARIARPTTHPPAIADCTSCHHPHQSEHAYQLADAVPTLCFACHDSSDAALAAKHLNVLEESDCLACHHRHGSEGASLLLTRSVHPNFIDGCTSCHTPGNAAEFLRATKSEICVACHADIPEEALNAKTPHPAMEAAECTDCHASHVSREERLVRFASGGECTTCHADKAPGEGERSHGAVGFLGCRGCHEPHGGARTALLRAGGSELCIGCHAESTRRSGATGTVTLLDHFELSGDEAVRALRIPALRLAGGVVLDHPLAGHRATGAPTAEELAAADASFSGELECISCHDPHKGRTENHFKGDPATAAELCLSCHRK